MLFKGGGSYPDFFVNWPNDPYWATTIYPIPLQLNTFAGNVNLGGVQLVEGNDGIWQPGIKEHDTIKFTPTIAGWYRIMGTRAYFAGKIQIYSDSWLSGLTDTEFSFRADSYSTATNSFGQLTQTRAGNYNWSGGNVPSARIVTDWGSSSLNLWLDLYVPNVSGAREIAVTASGPYRARLLKPYIVTNAPPNFQQINFQ